MIYAISMHGWPVNHTAEFETMNLSEFLTSLGSLPQGNKGTKIDIER